LRTQQTKLEKILRSKVALDPVKRLAIESQIKRINELLKIYMEGNIDTLSAALILSPQKSNVSPTKHALRKNTLSKAPKLGSDAFKDAALREIFKYYAGHSLKNNVKFEELQ
jgi:hypothetical protein